MPQAKFIPILTAANGLNNVKDPVRLAYDLDTGETELAVAVNVDVDQTGRVSRRLGYTQKRSEASHSGYVDGGICLFAAGENLYRLHTDYSRESLASVTEGRRVSYWPVADRIYWMNGREKGYVKAGKSYPWQAGDYSGPETNRQFLDPPDGHLISYFGGSMLVAVDNAIFHSEPFAPGWFDLARNFVAEADRITMMRPVSGGVFVATRKKIMFYRGNSFQEGLSREVVVEYGVLEGSDTYCPAEKVRLEVDGQVALWATPEGICFGGPGGTFRNLTFEKLSFPSGHFAAGGVVDNRYLVLTQP